MNPKLVEAIGEELFTMADGDAMYYAIAGLPQLMDDEEIVKYCTMKDPDGRKWTCQPKGRLQARDAGKKTILVRAAFTPPKTSLTLKFAGKLYPLSITEHDPPGHVRNPFAKAPARDEANSKSVSGLVVPKPKPKPAPPAPVFNVPARACWPA